MPFCVIIRRPRRAGNGNWTSTCISHVIHMAVAFLGKLNEIRLLR